MLTSIESSLHDLAHAFYDGDQSRLTKTLQFLRTFEVSFENDVLVTIEEAKAQMTCCQVVHSFPAQSSNSWVYLLFAFLVLCALAIFWPSASHDQHGPLLAFSNKNG